MADEVSPDKGSRLAIPWPRLRQDFPLLSLVAARR